MRRALLAALLAACATLGPADYAGTWNNTSGTQVTTCPGMAAQTANYAANTFALTITAATGANIQISIPLGATPCTVMASVDADATLQPATCNGVSFTTGHLTLDDAHVNMHLVADATASGCTQHYDVLFHH